MLATVRRADGKPRIAEVPLGMPLRDLLGELDPAAAVLSAATTAPGSPAAQARRAHPGQPLAGQAGARVGAGVVISLPADRCGLVETASVVRYLALESRGPVRPVPERPAQDRRRVRRARQRPRPAAAVATCERWAGLVTGRGACHHPDGTARFVRSALRTFAAEVDRHAARPLLGGQHAPFLPIPQHPARTEDDWI